VATRFSEESRINAPSLLKVVENPFPVIVEVEKRLNGKPGIKRVSCKIIGADRWEKEECWSGTKPFPVADIEVPSVIEIVRGEVMGVKEEVTSHMTRCSRIHEPTILDTRWREESCVIPLNKRRWLKRGGWFMLNFNSAFSGTLWMTFGLRIFSLTFVPLYFGTSLQTAASVVRWTSENSVIENHGRGLSNSADPSICWQHVAKIQHPEDRVLSRLSCFFQDFLITHTNRKICIRKYGCR
jgi:hypothetical protein